MTDTPPPDEDLPPYEPSEYRFEPPGCFDLISGELIGLGVVLVVFALFALRDCAG